jgi:hypothetical protein
MLAALNQHCHPDSVANAFTTLMFLFNDSVGKLEEIMAYRSRFDWMVNYMSRCKIILPPVLMVMFFLRSLQSCHNNLLEQFCSRYKSLKGASINSIVADMRYHNEFKLVGSDKKVPAGKGPKAAAAAASSAIDKQGKDWRNPYKWLASFDIKGIKKWRMRFLAGNGFCPILAMVVEEYNSDDNFCWDGDHTVVESLPPLLAPPPFCCANRPINLLAASSSKCIVIWRMEILSCMQFVLHAGQVGVFFLKIFALAEQLQNSERLNFVRKKKRRRPRKARRWLHEGKVPCALNQIFFLVHEYLGSERPVLFEVSAPTRLNLRGSHVRRKFRKRTARAVP